MSEVLPVAVEIQKAIAKFSKLNEIRPLAHGAPFGICLLTYIKKTTKTDSFKAT